LPNNNANAFILFILHFILFFIFCQRFSKDKNMIVTIKPKDKNYRILHKDEESPICDVKSKDGKKYKGTIIEMSSNGTYKIDLEEE